MLNGRIVSYAKKTIGVHPNVHNVHSGHAYTHNVGITGVGEPPLLLYMAFLE